MTQNKTELVEQYLEMLDQTEIEDLAFNALMEEDVQALQDMIEELEDAHNDG